MDAKASECTAHVAALQRAHAVELQNLAQQYEARLDKAHVSARDDRAEAQAILEDMLRRVRDAVPLTELCACQNEAFLSKAKMRPQAMQNPHLSNIGPRYALYRWQASSRRSRLTILQTHDGVLERASYLVELNASSCNANATDSYPNTACVVFPKQPDQDLHWSRSNSWIGNSDKIMLITYRLELQACTMTL